MAAKPETTYIGKVHKHLSRDVYHMKNNNQYTGGIPDVYYSGSRYDLWIEYKYLPKIPTRAIVDPKKLLSSLQLQWLNGRYDEGRNVAVIIGCPAGGVLLRNKAWETEMSAVEYKALIVSNLLLTRWIEIEVGTR